MRCYSTSRGNLVSSFLLSNNPGGRHMTSEDQVRNIVVPYDAKFAGFNLLLLTPSSSSSSSTTSSTPLDSDNDDDNGTTSSIIRYESLLVTNHGGGGAVTSRTLTSSERSCGALSNAVDGADAHLWPKALHATAHFPAVVESRSTDPTDVELVEHLFKLLAWVPNFFVLSPFAIFLISPFLHCFVSFSFFFSRVFFFGEGVLVTNRNFSDKVGSPKMAPSRNDQKFRKPSKSLLPCRHQPPRVTSHPCRLMARDYRRYY